MRWQDGRRGDVEDRRGMTTGHYVGGGGVVVVIVALIGYVFFGIDPSRIMGAADQAQMPAASQGQASTGVPSDEEGAFASTIYASANDTWSKIFQAQGKSYHDPKMVLYTSGTQTACGYGQAAMGPFYCPEDQSVYLDLDFFQTLDRQLGAPGDFAKAYVIAHEMGHHIQKLTGISDAVTEKEQHVGKTAANALSVKLELQADCYAGVWAKRSNDEKHWIEDGDVDEAINAASAVGDDTLQQETQGQVVPDSFTHGTSAQRVRWFRTGFSSGNPASCDTFS